ncbi:glutaredoxin 3 [Caballeronia insecticola]|uniref:Glutaredoxin n=1 Tax=Caballeronia insecticola TaxID=758793 RepID=A0A060PRD1_9BURK|nr:glutaredoxin 3 [Caballeronia insecticola]BAO94194.1 glutaredoxin [Caballeronia insecticola]
MAKVTMYSQQVCPFCDRAERLLRSRGVDVIEKIMVDTDREQRALMVQRTGRRTVPQIYVEDTHVGGFDDLVALDREGGLLALLDEKA